MMSTTMVSLMSPIIDATFAEADAGDDLNASLDSDGRLRVMKQSEDLVCC